MKVAGLLILHPSSLILYCYLVDRRTMSARGASYDFPRQFTSLHGIIESAVMKSVRDYLVFFVVVISLGSAVSLARTRVQQAQTQKTDLPARPVIQQTQADKTESTAR